MMVDVLNALTAHGNPPKQRGSGFDARCPAHDDHEPSLHIEDGDKGGVVLKCYAGCELDAVLEAIGLDREAIRPPKEEDELWTPAGRALDVYRYTDEEGNLLFEVVRCDGKKFLQRRPDPSAPHGWRWKLGDVRRPLYRLPRVLKAIEEGETVYVVEGEKDVRALEQAGCVATCNPGGVWSGKPDEKKWLPEHTATLAEADVVIVADRDDVGRRHARAVAQALEGVARSVIRVEAAEGKDAFDHFAAGLGVDDFLELTESEEAVDLAPHIAEFLTQTDTYHWLVPGLLERGDRLMLTGFEGGGKALALDTPIPTSNGWETMGTLHVGAEVFGPDGRPCRVVAVSEVMLGRPCYRVRFSDGSELVADEQHGWLTETLKCREAIARYARKPTDTKSKGRDQRHKRLHFPAVVTTADIASTLQAREGHTWNHAIPTCEPLQYPGTDLPIRPYTLGAWLGDGTSLFASITCADDEILEAIRSDGYVLTHMEGLSWRITDTDRADALAKAFGLAQEGVPLIEIARRVGIHRATIRKYLERAGIVIPARHREPISEQVPWVLTFQGKLRTLGVLGNKHIPAIYLQASVEDRIALLQGLMDTDGTIDKGGSQRGRWFGSAMSELSLCDETLAKNAHELLLGLGIKVTWRSSPAKLYGRTVGTRYRLLFQTDLPVFRLPRKVARHTPMRTRRASLRYVTAVDRVPSVPVRCIQVDRPDGLFVAGRACITTHNSEMLRQIAVCVAAGMDPFRLSAIPPRRVLFIDAENSERHTRRKLRPLYELVQARGPFDPRNLRIIMRPAGLDLTQPEDAAWLHERVIAHKPELLIIGPLYRLHAQNPNDELAARATVAALDAARTAVDCAVVIEAHAGHSEFAGQRGVRPLGSSLWLRWPEFGYGMRPDKKSNVKGRMQFTLWRGPRDERQWPTNLDRGRTWPWEGVWTDGIPSVEMDEDDF